MSHPIASFFSINTQFDNVGDALINRELVKLAADQGPVMVNLSRCPPRFRETLGLDNLPNVTIVDGSSVLFREMFKHRMKAGIPVFFLKPGAYLGGLGASFLPKGIAIIFFQLLMTLLGTKICQIGVSYERLTPFHSWFLRVRRPLLFAHYVRDEKSFAYAMDQGLKPDGIKPDLAFNIYDKYTETQGEPKTIAMSFRTDQYPEQYDHVASLVRWLLAKLKAYGPEQVRFVAQVKRDIAPAQQLAEIVGKGFAIKTEVITCFDSVTACEQAYAGCDLIVSNRLHSLLIGGSQCSKVLGCTSGTVNEKIIGLFNTLDLRDHLISIETFDDAQATAALDHALAHNFDGRPIAASLKQGMQRMFSDMG